jgi:hypothetical protein
LRRLSKDIQRFIKGIFNIIRLYLRWLYILILNFFQFLYIICTLDLIIIFNILFYYYSFRWVLFNIFCLLNACSYLWFRLDLLFLFLIGINVLIYIVVVLSLDWNKCLFLLIILDRLLLLDLLRRLLCCVAVILLGFRRIS